MSDLFGHGAFMEELRRRRGKVPADLYADIMAALEAGLGRAPKRAPRDEEPAWLDEARRHMGLKEVPGKAHNAVIQGWLAKLGAWWRDDETPWCGVFTAHCMVAAGQPVPQYFMRAKAWAEWGKPTPPRIGAVAVFGREGGGHVGFVVGDSATALYILGGNQGNMVSIAPIAKARLIALRWPAALPLSTATLPRMAGGAISRNEA